MPIRAAGCSDEEQIRCECGQRYRFLENLMRHKKKCKQGPSVSPQKRKFVQIDGKFTTNQFVNLLHFCSSRCRFAVQRRRSGLQKLRSGPVSCSWIIGQVWFVFVATSARTVTISPANGRDSKVSSCNYTVFCVKKRVRWHNEHKNVSVRKSFRRLKENFDRHVLSGEEVHRHTFTRETPAHLNNVSVQTLYYMLFTHILL